MVSERDLDGREPGFFNIKDEIEIVYQKTQFCSIFDSTHINWYERSNIGAGNYMLKTIPTFDMEGSIVSG